MKTVRVNLGDRSYDILIGPGLLQQLSGIFTSQGIGPRLFLVANLQVFNLYGERVLRELSRDGREVTHILIPDGEAHKNLETVETIYTYLIAQKADRNCTLVALGGGVTGDVAGFVAATFLRGIPYVQIPTTLLAQVDSSVGGKTGVNHRLGKNLIGAFYQPHLVCVDTDTLETLSPREFQSGLYEVLKYGLIYDAEFFEFLEKHLPRVKSRAPEILEEVIGRCCEVKAEVISLDEREADLRRILNFGHTFGHALEAATRFQSLTHGEAVGYGMLAESALSRQLQYIEEADFQRIARAIHSLGALPPVSVPFPEIREAMNRDKKRHEDRIVFVLLKQIGKTVIRKDLDEELLARVWDEVRRVVPQGGRG